MASKVLTIEISNELIKLCEVTHQGAKNIIVNRAITIPTPEGSVDDGMLRNVQEIADAIKQAKDENIINSKDVVMTIQSTKIASKEAVLPNVKASKINDLIRANATEYFPINNLEDYSLTHTVLENIVKDKEKNVRILAMAAPLNIVTPYYDLAKRLGLNVIAVDYIGNSTLQMLKLQIDEAPSMVIQIGNDSTLINVMKNKVLQFQRTVPYGRSSVINAVMESKKLSYGVALELLGKGSIIHETFDGEEITESLRYLVNSISRIIDYYIARNQDSPIEKAYIMGDGASVVGIEKLFANELNIDFTKLTELKNVETDKFFRISKQELIQYMSTVGACLAPVNFKSVVSAKKSKDGGVSLNGMKYAVIGLIVSVIASVILVAIPAVRLIGLEAKKSDLEKKIKNLEGAKITYDKYIIAKNQRDNLANFYTNVSSNNNDMLYEFIRDLEKNLPSDTILRDISFNNGAVSMNGVCRGKETLAKTLMQLKGMKNVYAVLTKGGSEEMSDDGVVTVSFNVTCVFVDPTDKLGALLKGEVNKEEATDASTENKEDKKEGN